MSQLRINFLNWRPDQDEFQNELTTADNVVHDTEGYKQVHLKSAGAFNTIVPASWSVTSVVAQQAVQKGTAFTAFVGEAIPGGPTNTLNFGVFYTTTDTMYRSLWVDTGYPTANAFATGGTNQAVVAFDHCYLGDQVFMVAVADQDVAATAGTQTVAALGYGDNQLLE